MKKHHKYLEVNEWLHDKNKRVDMPEHMSYSMMHSFDEGFSIVMYSCTHNTKQRDNSIHADHGVRIILGNGMNVIWPECTLHSGAKSRSVNAISTITKKKQNQVSPRPALSLSPTAKESTAVKDKIGVNISASASLLSPALVNPCLAIEQKVKTDLRFFSYLWKSGRYSRKSIAKENGTDVYRTPNILCKNFTKRTNWCGHCGPDIEFVLDLSTVTDDQYRSGEIIAGDLDMYGWVVVRGAIIDNDTKQEINAIAERGEWHCIESGQSKRKMKYNINSKPPIKQWGTKKMTQFKDDIKKLNLDVVFKNENYVIGKFNLLKNDGYIPYGQDPHYDYPRRTQHPT